MLKVNIRKVAELMEETILSSVIGCHRLRRFHGFRIFQARADKIKYKHLLCGSAKAYANKNLPSVNSAILSNSHA